MCIIAQMSKYSKHILATIAVKSTNPHIRFFDSSHWGYSIVEFNNQYCEYTVFDIDKSENNANVRKRVRKRLLLR